MKKLNMLAIDLGASSGRGIIGSFDGKKLTLNENHRFVNEPQHIAGRFTWDIVRIFCEIKNSIRASILNGDDVVSMGIDTWGVDYGLIDRHGHLLANPTHYRDTRTDGITAYTDSMMSVADIYATTGIQTMDFNTVFQLAAEMRDNPELISCAHKLLFVPDLLGYLLTGQCATEYTIASTGAILNAATRDYAWNVIEKLGIPERLFTNIVNPGYRLGKLLPEVQGDVGKTDLDVVKVASHDTASAVLAVPAKSENFIYISSGTWSLMGTELEAPLVNEDSARMNYTNEGGAEGTIRFLKNIMGLWILQESRRQWKREGKDYSFSDLALMAKTAKPLASIIDPDDKLFATPGDMPRRIADYCRMTGQPVPETEGETVRCILDSLALRYRCTVEAIAELTGNRAEAVNIVGGGTQDKLLCQLTADACGLDVIAGPVEATAIGNICMQAIAAGELANMSEAREVVAASFDTEHYTPSAEGKKAFDAAYEKFLKLSHS